jgi:hypothetical protein
MQKSNELHKEAQILQAKKTEKLNNDIYEKIQLSNKTKLPTKSKKILMDKFQQ